MKDPLFLEFRSPEAGRGQQASLGEVVACLQEAADEELTRVRDADAAVLYALADGLGTLVRVPDPDEQSAA